MALVDCMEEPTADQDTVHFMEVGVGGSLVLPKRTEVLFEQYWRLLEEVDHRASSSTHRLPTPRVVDREDVPLDRMEPMEDERGVLTVEKELPKQPVVPVEQAVVVEHLHHRVLLMEEVTVPPDMSSHHKEARVVVVEVLGYLEEVEEWVAIQLTIQMHRLEVEVVVVQDVHRQHLRVNNCFVMRHRSVVVQTLPVRTVCITHKDHGLDTVEIRIIKFRLISTSMDMVVMGTRS